MFKYTLIVILCASITTQSLYSMNNDKPVYYMKVSGSELELSSEAVTAMIDRQITQHGKCFVLKMKAKSNKFNMVKFGRYSPHAINLTKNSIWDIYKITRSY